MRNRLLAAALAAVLAFSCAACNGGGAPAAPGTAPAGPSGGGQLALAPGGGPRDLPAGTYTNGAAPRVGFRVGEGWSAELPAEGYLRLTRDGGALVVMTPGAAIDAATGDPAALPPDVAAWLSADARLAATKPSSLQVDNVPARQLEARVAAGARSPVRLLAAGGAVLELAAGERAHFVVVEANAGPLVIAAVAPEAEFGAFFSEVERVVGSMTVPD